MQHSDKMREAVLELQCSRAPPERTFRIIVMGAPGVGKTTIANRFLFAGLPGGNNTKQQNQPHQRHINSSHHMDSPSDQAQRMFANNYPTSGDNYHRKVYNIRGDVFELDIVDTSGFNPFPALKSQRMGIMSGDLFVIVFSLTSKQSFEYAKRLRQEIIDVKCASFVEHLRCKKKSSGSKANHKIATSHHHHQNVHAAGNNSSPDASTNNIAPAYVAVASKRVQVPMILVGNKMETCESAREVSKIDINQYLTSFQEDDDMPYVVCSAISGLYVADIFALLFAFSRLPPELLTAPTLLSSVCEHGLTNDGSNNTTTADTLYYGCANNNALVNNGSAANGNAHVLNGGGGEKKRRFSIVPRTPSTRHRANTNIQQQVQPTETNAADNAAPVQESETSVITAGAGGSASMRRKPTPIAATQRSVSRLSIKHDKLAPTSSDASLTSNTISTSTNLGIAIIAANGAVTVQNGNLTNGAAAGATSSSSPLHQTLLNRTSSTRRPLTAVTSTNSSNQQTLRAFATVMAYARRPSLRSEIETIKWRQDNPFYIVKRNNNESLARRLIGRLGIGERCISMIDGVGGHGNGQYSSNHQRRGGWWKPGWFNDHGGGGGEFGHYPGNGRQSRARSTSREDTLRKSYK